MNSRQRKKRSKWLDYILEEECKTKGRRVYSYKAVHNNLITLAYTARPKQKGCYSYSEKYILEELHLYGNKSAYEFNLLF